MNKCALILWFGSLRVQIAGVDGWSVRDGVDECQRSRSLCRWTREGVANPREGGRITTIKTRNLANG
jgi:hypothetical protein